MRQMFIAVLAIIAGCAQASEQPPSGELRPPSDATSVKHVMVEGFERIDYKLVRSFPPRELIKTIAANAKQHGWKPLRDSAFNQDERSAYVEGWRKRVVASNATGPRRWAYIWWSQWRKASGDILDVALSYTYPLKGTPDLTTLTVGSSITSAERFKQIGLSAKSFHDAPTGSKPNTETVIEEPHLDLENRKPGPV